MPKELPQRLPLASQDNVTKLIQGNKTSVVEKDSKQIHSVGKKKQRSSSASKIGESSLSKTERSIPDTASTLSDHVIYVGHLPEGFTEVPLRRFLAQYGEIMNLVLSRSAKTGRPRGYGFVQFAEEGTAAQTAKALHGAFLGGRSLVSHIVPKMKQHKKMFHRRDQRLRVVMDQRRRREGYIAKPTRTVRALASLQDALDRNIALENRCNARLKKLGIDYYFDRFNNQSKVLTSS